MRASMLAFTVVVGVAAGARATDIAPMQADLSFANALGKVDGYGVQLYVGAAHGECPRADHVPTRDAPAACGVPYGGFGLELAYAFPELPYRISFGPQIRIGYAWARDEGRPGPLPDVHAYVRISPYYASSGALTGTTKNEQTGKEERVPGVPSAPHNYLGARLGVGVTAMAWSRTFFNGDLLPEDPGLFHETVRVLASLILLPIALANHVELTWELTLSDQGTLHQVAALRVGAGF